MKNKTADKRELSLLQFLIRTKNGKYAPIDSSSFPYARLREETEEINACEEVLFYTLA
ncbi:MAG: hypothetical protein NTZ95_01460 [Candidatus Omnitrophica bacterium]|nr:hypothetical protein [Candidatus Omnitrophota bacterium]